ncbi:Asp-tRNA(Asn)/Glu-tRNA(Gln) amidotransferase subunit GatC [Candidatus Saganbacteria bacterium]|nr:Asp-tRNA(Asn)/Glu-tRNA(Gln) amidotransferase subunit GatC [Candidatus Saganbacteria bacterium]
MKIDVDHVAKLARLGLSDIEQETFGKQLGDILKYADNLGKLDLKDIPSTSHAIPMKNVMREDIVEKCEDIKSILANGPEVENNMFKVPRIIE